MADESFITPEMQDAIGIETAPWTVEVDKTAVRMFARAVGHTDPVFYDEAEAKRRGYRSLPVPPGYLGTPVFNPRGGEPRIGRRAFQSKLTRGLNGGTEVEYLGDICAGDVLTARAKIESIQQRNGSLGPMLITTTVTSYTNQDGKLVALMRGTGIAY
jgi:hypothetical protein